LATGAGGTAQAQNTAAVSGVASGDLDFLGLATVIGGIGGVIEDLADYLEPSLAMAGNDVILAGGSEGSLVAGDALTSGEGGNADADNLATVSDGGAG